MKLVLLGAPGAGKGTQAKLLSREYDIPHISTGDILRKQIADKTELGNKVKDIIESGNLVPDEIILAMMEKRLAENDCQKGFILDGFPRTKTQAEQLGQLTDLDAVVDIDVPFDILVERISGRRMCECGETFHVSNFKSEFCDKCGKRLYQRKDDTVEVVEERIKVYKKQTAPLIDYYAGAGILLTVDGTVGVENVCREIKNKLSEV